MRDDEGESATLLAEVPLFQDLSATDMRALARRATPCSFAKDDILFEEGGEPDHLFVLLHGMIELHATRRKRKAGILIMWPRSVFLPAAALSKGPYLLAACALTPVKTLALDARGLRRDVEQSGPLAGAFTRLLAAQFRMLVRHVKDQKLRSGPQRLCAFLCRLIRDTGSDSYADLPISKSTLASRLGMTPENLSRSLKVVAQHGITVRGSRIIMTDPVRAFRFCDPDPLFDGPEDGSEPNNF